MDMFIMVKSMTVRLGAIDATAGDLTSMRQHSHKVRSLRQAKEASESKAMQVVKVLVSRMICRVLDNTGVVLTRVECFV
jgi:hypothetical protein